MQALNEAAGAAFLLVYGIAGTATYVHLSKHPELLPTLCAHMDGEPRAIASCAVATMAYSIAWPAYYIWEGLEVAVP